MTKWYHKKWAVLLILATVGPLGLPLLWKSPEFGRVSKWIMTVTTVLITLLLIFAAEMLPLLVSQALLQR